MKLERHIFNARVQEENEAFDDYLTDLKLLSRNCNYCDNCYPGILRDRVVAGIQSDPVRKKLLSEIKLTLEKTVHICRAAEKATEGMESFKNKDGESEIAWLKGRNKAGTGQQDRGMKRFDNSKDIKCKFCVRTHPFGKSNCPAWGKQCYQCKGMNHFANSNTCPAKGNQDKNSADKGTGVNEVRGLESGVGALFLGKVGTTKETISNMK